MKKTFLVLALLGTGAASWGQTTGGSGNTKTTTTNSSNTPNSSNTTTTDATTPNNNTSTNTGVSQGTDTTGNGINSNRNSGTNLGTNSGVNSGTDLNGSSPATNSGTGTTDSTVNPVNSTTTGTLQNNASAGTDHHSIQNTQGGNTQVTTQLSTGNYAAYGDASNVPGHLQTSLQRDYPSAFNPSWQQSGDWYRASFNNTNRNISVYYAPNGNSYSVALPITTSFVPEEVVTRAINMFGNNLYSINRIRGANGQDNYHVLVIENGVSRSEFIGENGMAIAAADIFRVDTDGEMIGTQLNNTSSNAGFDSSSRQGSQPLNNAGQLNMPQPSGTNQQQLNNAQQNSNQLNTTQPAGTQQQTTDQMNSNQQQTTDQLNTTQPQTDSLNTTQPNIDQQNNIQPNTDLQNSNQLNTTQPAGTQQDSSSQNAGQGLHLQNPNTAPLPNATGTRTEGDFSQYSGSQVTTPTDSTQAAGSQNLQMNQNTTGNAAQTTDSTSVNMNGQNAAGQDGSTQTLDQQTTTQDSLQTGAVDSANTGMNKEVEYKQKIKTSDGRKQKVKVEEGEVKVKGDLKKDDE